MRVAGAQEGASPDGIDLIMSISRFLRLETVAKMIETQTQLDGHSGTS
jgi:hypothetical protein